MDGLLLVDKPAGITSHDAVDRVRKIAKTRRVGHAGTLDPFATGLLILGINKGTKTLTGLVGLDKTYEATARLGATSTTDDPEGTVTETGTKAPTRDDVEAAMAKFRGGYLQTAPAFSAKKIGGKKLYDLARAGKMDGVELPQKQVTITELEIIDFSWPNLQFRVSCSSGTYIRALARDIGEALPARQVSRLGRDAGGGCGAYLTQLRRTRIGSYDIKNATALDALDEARLNEVLLS